MNDIQLAHIIYIYIYIYIYIMFISDKYNLKKMKKVQYIKYN